VTRIIAGAARGRRLRVPAEGTRPTTDRVREALFARLDHLLGGFAGVRVLDLFAGSGALGLEAASRGAAAVVLVERDRRAAAVARANAGAVGVPGVRVVQRPVSAYLREPPRPFDLVLADPPYEVASGDVEALLGRLCRGWLAPRAVVVVERPTRGGDLRWPVGIGPLRAAVHGETTLWYGRGAPKGEDQ